MIRLYSRADFTMGREASRDILRHSWFGVPDRRMRAQRRDPYRRVRHNRRRRTWSRRRDHGRLGSRRRMGGMPA